MNFNVLVSSLNREEKLDLAHTVVGELSIIERQEFLVKALESIFRKQNADIQNYEYTIEEQSRELEEQEERNKK